MIFQDDFFEDKTSLYAGDNGDVAVFADLHVTLFDLLFVGDIECSGHTQNRGQLLDQKLLFERETAVKKMRLLRVGLAVIPGDTGDATHLARGHAKKIQRVDNVLAVFMVSPVVDIKAHIVKVTGQLQI